MFKQDELLWAAAWLQRATKMQKYLDYLGGAGDTGGVRTVFSWDDKYVGAHVLAAKVSLIIQCCIIIYKKIHYQCIDYIFLLLIIKHFFIFSITIYYIQPRVRLLFLGFFDLILCIYVM